LTTLKDRKIREALKSKGFQEKNRKNHKMYIFVYKGKRTGIKTIMSYGEIEYSNNLISLMKKELKLSKGEFMGIIDCSLKEEDLVNIYIHKGIIIP